MSESFFNFPVRIPENSDSFKEWEKRHEAGIVDEPVSNPAPAYEEPELFVQIPENSESFKEWQRNHETDEQ